ncbi:MAG: signal peptidase I [Microthrixaceae bacterium]
MNPRAGGDAPARSQGTWVVPAPQLDDDGKPAPTRAPYPKSSVTPAAAPAARVRANPDVEAPRAEPAPPQPSMRATGGAAADDGRAVGRADDAPSDSDPAGGSTAHRGSVSPRVRNWLETIAVFAVGLVLALVLRSYVLQAFSIPSDSMVPTLVQGDRVVVWKPSDAISGLNRGDVVVFERPNVPECPFAPQDPKDLIKRLIGLPGEEVFSQNGQVTIDGRLIDESYLPPGTATEFDRPITVPEGRILMLGDNRGASKDGRCFGPIEEDAIVGRATTRVWPVDRWGGL